MIHTTRNRTRTGLVAAVAALTASIAIGTAVAAPPIKNAQRTCAGLGGAFRFDASQYSCSGTDLTKTFSFFASSQHQCVRPYKGIFTIPLADTATGAWRYTCELP
jgi:hypothetical protein